MNIKPRDLFKQGSWCHQALDLWVAVPRERRLKPVLPRFNHQYSAQECGVLKHPLHDQRLFSQEDPIATTQIPVTDVPEILQAWVIKIFNVAQRHGGKVLRNRWEHQGRQRLPGTLRPMSGTDPEHPKEVLSTPQIENPVEASPEDERVAELLEHTLDVPILASAIEAQDAADAADLSTWNQ